MRSHTKYSILGLILTGFFVLPSLSFSEGQHRPKKISSQKIWNQLHYVDGCRVYDSQGKLMRDFPGRYCLFLDDGRFISSGKNLILFDRDRSKVWEIPGHFHHQMNFTRDKKHILVLSSEVETINEKQVRADVFLKISLKGEIVARLSTKKIFEDHKIQPISWPFVSSGSSLKADLEISHFNSIYEIGSNRLEKSDRRFAAGNILINSAGVGAFILDAAMTKSLYFSKFPQSDGHRVHDLQLTEDGEFFFFNNHNSDQKRGPYSSIDFMDPIRLVTRKRFTTKPKEFFYAPIRGSAKMIDADLILVSDSIRGKFIISKSKMELVHANPFLTLHPERLTPVPLEDLRSIDLTSFLEQWETPFSY